jgi:archaemetzincin
MRIPEPLRMPIIPVLLLMIATLSAIILARPDPEAPVDPVAAVGSLRIQKPHIRATFTNSGEFKPKRPPAPNDWLASHAEPGQTYDDWLASRPNLPDATRRKIHFLPIGEFNPQRAPSLEALREIAAAWFHPMPVEILPTIPDDALQVASRIHPATKQKQWRSDQILTSLPNKLPADSYCMVAITMTDLYPGDSWNFVFGQASLRSRVGIFSFARYHPAFHGEPTTPETPNLILRRAAKVLVHETGHLFGIRHCIYHECNLNGANHLQEMDASPLHLCPVCLRKIHHATRFDPVTRYSALKTFYQKHNFTHELAWTNQRILKISNAQ